MSYGGYEYNAPGMGGGNFGFDPMGGGFGDGMDAGGGFSNDNQGSATKTPEKKGTRDRQSLLPMTIKQVHSISEEDGAQRLDNVEVFSVRIVGTIHSIEAHATNVMYKISDGTGMLDCKSFIEKEGVGSAKFADCREQSLVRVNGNIRIYEGHKSLMIFHMSVIHDWNELTHHLLESIHTHLKNTRGPLPSGVQGQGQGQAFGQHGQSMHDAMAMRQNVSVFAKTEHTGAQNAVVELRDKIVQAYRILGDSDSGAGFPEVLGQLAQMGAPISMHQLKHEVEYLANEGTLYTTIDETHYRTTDGM